MCTYERSTLVKPAKIKFDHVVLSSIRPSSIRPYTPWQRPAVSPTGTQYQHVVNLELSLSGSVLCNQSYRFRKEASSHHLQATGGAGAWQPPVAFAPAGAHPHSFTLSTTAVCLMSGVGRTGHEHETHLGRQINNVTTLRPASKVMKYPVVTYPNGTPDLSLITTQVFCVQI